MMICSLAAQAQDTTVYTRVTPGKLPRYNYITFYYGANGNIVNKRRFFIQEMYVQNLNCIAVFNSENVDNSKQYELLEDGNIKPDAYNNAIAHTADNYRKEYTPKPDRKIASPPAKFPPYSQQYMDMTNEQKVVYLDSLAANNIRVNH